MDARLVGRPAPLVGSVDTGRDAYGRPLRSVAGGRVGGGGLTGSGYPLSYQQQQQQQQQQQHQPRHQQQTAYRGGGGGSMEEPVNPQALGGVLDQIISPGAVAGAMLGGPPAPPLALSGRPHEEMMSIMSTGATTTSALARGGGGSVGGGCGSVPGAPATRFYGRPPPPPVAYTASTAGPPLPLCVPLAASSSLTSAVSATPCPPQPPKVSPRGVMGGFFEGDADGLDEQAMAEAEADAAAAASPMGGVQPMYAWPSRGGAADAGRHGGTPSGAATAPPPPVRQTSLAGRRPPGLDLPHVGGVQRPALSVPAWPMSHAPITPWVNDPPAVTAAAALPPPPPPAAYGPPAGVAAAAAAAGPSAAAARRRRRWELTRPPAVTEKKPYINVDGVVSASELLSRRNRTTAAAAVAGAMSGVPGHANTPALGGRGGVGSAGAVSLPGSLAAGAPGVTASKMTDKERRVLRRLRNRESAERCRLRAVGRADETRRAAANLASENNRLAEEVARLSAEVQALVTDVVARGGSVRGIEGDLVSG